MTETQDYPITIKQELAKFFVALVLLASSATHMAPYVWSDKWEYGLNDLIFEEWRFFEKTTIISDGRSVHITRLGMFSEYRRITYQWDCDCIVSMGDFEIQIYAEPDEASFGFRIKNDGGFLSSTEVQQHLKNADMFARNVLTLHADHILLPLQ